MQALLGSEESFTFCHFALPRRRKSEFKTTLFCKLISSLQLTITEIVKFALSQLLLWEFSLHLHFLWDKTKLLEGRQRSFRSHFCIVIFLMEMMTITGKLVCSGVAVKIMR